MENIATNTIPTFESVWTALQKTDIMIKETSEQMKETNRKLEKTIRGLENLTQTSNNTTNVQMYPETQHTHR